MRPRRFRRCWRGFRELKTRGPQRQSERVVFVAIGEYGRLQLRLDTAEFGRDGRQVLGECGGTSLDIRVEQRSPILTFASLWRSCIFWVRVIVNLPYIR